MSEKRDDQIDLLRMVEDDHVDRVAMLEQRIARLEKLVMPMFERLRASTLDNILLGGPVQPGE